MGFIAETITAYAIGKGLDMVIANREDFHDRLTSVIEAVNDEFKATYKTHEPVGKYAFFRSEALMAEMLKFRLFKGSGYEIDREKLRGELGKHPNFILPTDEELINYMNLFDSRVKDDEKLRMLEVESFYKEEVFSITRKLDRFYDSFETSINQPVLLLESEYKRELKECLSEIHEFNPKSALTRIEGIEQQVNENPDHTSNHFKAYLYYLKAICQELLENIQEARENIVRAYNFDPRNSSYQQRACFTFFTLKNVKYKELVRQLESEDEYSPFLWAVKALESPGPLPAFLKDEVPEPVIYKAEFKRCVYSQLAEALNNELLEVMATLKEEPLGELPDQVSYGNFHYWLFKFNLSVSLYMMQNPLLLYTKAGETSQGQLLHQLAEKLLTVLRPSEIYERYIALEFIYYWLEYEQFEKENTLMHLRHAFHALPDKQVRFVFLFAHVLHKEGLSEEALAVIHTSGANTDRLLVLLKAYCHHNLNNMEGYIKSVAEYLTVTDVIGEGEIAEILDLLHSAKLVPEKVPSLLEKLAAVNFSKEDHAVLVRLFLESFQPSLGECAPTAALHDLVHRLAGEQHLYYYIAHIYFNWEETREGVSLLKSYVDENKESRDLLLYIKGLDKLKSQDQLLLLRLLKKWREQFSFQDDLLRKETEIRSYLKDWPEIEKIAAYGLTKLPDDEGYLTALLFSLDHLNQESGIEKITHKLEGYKFDSTANALLAGGVLLRRKYYRLALEILYDKAVNISDTQARQSYFTLSVHLPPDFMKEYEVVEEGRFVKYSIDGKEQIFPVNKETRKHNLIVKESINRRTGETFVVETGLSRRIQQVTVRRVMDQYLALHDELLLEVKNNPFNSLPFEEIQVDTHDIKAFEKAFVEIFGPQEDERQKHREKNLKEYYAYNLTFTELAVSNFDRDFISAYYTLTSLKGNGFVTTPLHYFHPGVDMAHSKFVVDFTSALLLFELSKELSLVTSQFVVPNSLVGMLDREILKARHDPKSNMSVSVVQGKLVPHFYPDDFNSRRLAFLEQIRQWLSAHASIEIPFEKLDLTRELYEERDMKSELEYVIDNITLANRGNHVLLTDDAFYFKFLAPQRGEVIGTEYYLLKAFPEKQEEIVKYLLQKKYLGLTVDERHIRDAYFDQYKPASSHVYNVALHNLTHRHNITNATFDVSIKFLKSIALNSSISDEKYLVDATNLFVLLLKSVTDQESGALITGAVQREFNLLPKHLLLTLHAIKDALKII